MITPLDIQNKEFSKVVRGYKEDDVDSFLDLITFDVERLITENSMLKNDNARLNKELQRYRGSEGVVLETLEAAKALMGDICASAERRAEILLKNAELDAELIQREAKESVEKLTEESLSLRHRFTTFQTKYKALLESELERFDGLSVKLFAEFGIDEMNMQKDNTLKPWQESRETKVLKPLSEEEIKKTMLNLRIGEGE
ncbi:MAG TPA: DivIVA domain-containing protein [Anaerovoracaceae bacterium]|nr:DivIVA domain-containing protein [Anaerovoracaceae bacterium]